MKKSIFIALIFALLNSFASNAQDHKKGIFKQKLPSIQLQTLNGEMINVKDLSNNGNPMIISFWATWCTPCKKELNTIKNMYIDWQDETGVKLIAVSVDDSRTVSRVRPYVNSHAWDYQILLDKNGEFRRAMGINNVPFTLVLDGNGIIRYKHNNYSPGDEYELYDEIIKLSKED